MKNLKAVVIVLVIVLIGFIASGFMHSSAIQAPQAVAVSAIGSMGASVDWKYIPFYSTVVNPKTVWKHILKDQLYDVNHGVLADSPTWSDCLKSITINSDGLFKDTPESSLPPGDYIWRQWNSSPAYNDQPDRALLVRWSGTKITWICEI